MKQILGLDLGEARTGVALSDELRMLAHPLETIESSSAETVARRYGISRQAQDEYGVRSQQRAAAALAAGKFADEIAPMTTVMGVADKDSGRITRREVTIGADEGIPLWVKLAAATPNRNVSVRI